MVSSLVSDDLTSGFLVANAVLVTFGLLCYAVPIRLDCSSARAIAWFWVGLELANGIAHLANAVLRGGYFSGAATAPLLLITAIVLGYLLVRDRPAMSDML